MARPANAHQASHQADRLLQRRLPGARGTSVAGHCQRSRHIATLIYRRWRTGPYEWQVKHLRWLLTEGCKDYQPGTRYRYWLTIRLLVIALGKDADWLPRLQGPWMRPTGDAGPLQIGRPIKRPT